MMNEERRDEVVDVDKELMKALVSMDTLCHEALEQIRSRKSLPAYNLHYGIVRVYDQSQLHAVD